MTIEKIHHETKGIEKFESKRRNLLILIDMNEITIKVLIFFNESN
jgi:hypothetical protein